MFAFLRSAPALAKFTAVCLLASTAPSLAYMGGNSAGRAAPAHKTAHAHHPAHMHKTPPAHQAHMPVSGTPTNSLPASSASLPRPRPAPVLPVAGSALALLPITGGLPSSVPRVTLHGDGDYARLYASEAPFYAPPPRRLEPGSFAPVDGRAFIGETPSGRVFMGAPAGVRTYAPHHRSRHAAAQSSPYAQPKFIVIGEASRRHMSKPVHMTYGVQPPKNLRPDPQVVWIRTERSARK